MIARTLLLASCIVACGVGTSLTTAAVPTASTPTVVGAPSLDECRATIAKRFHPPASWSKPWTKGPTDHVPECHPWWDGSPPPDEPVSPDKCPDSRGGWAGIGMSLARYGWGLSDDGLTMARCNDVCTALRVTDGRVLERSKPPDSIDGSPVTELPQNKELFRKYGLGSGTTTLPVADAFVDWSLAPKGAAVTYHLRDRKSGAHIAIGRFARREEYVFPEPWMISTNGRTLLLRALIRPENQGLDHEDAVVDVPAALALLYVEASAANPSSESLRTRAQNACDSLR